MQNLHKIPTPGIGGVALLAGAVAGGLAQPAESATLWWLVCLATLPAFISGLAEDITKRVGVRERLAATIIAGLIF
ncbi:MraY family glycosyltransferase [Pseudogemmobacter bohemicus]|uniref:hypothetical protein n=1 Tax=Pseudogemmobacter bohemicus TaxID=2250708 RepID=UPI001E3EB7BF|nr:hypothetical protein [Pseudogemmobacter bohemicus]